MMEPTFMIVTMGMAPVTPDIAVGGMVVVLLLGFFRIFHLIPMSFLLHPPVHRSASAPAAAANVASTSARVWAAETYHRPLPISLTPRRCIPSTNRPYLAPS